MYKGIKAEDVYPYVLENDRNDKHPTTWGLRPQTVSVGNRALTGYVRANQVRNREQMAAQTTKADLDVFLEVVAWVDGFCFHDKEEPESKISAEADLVKVFDELDINAYNELTNASRDVFSLKASEKKGLSSPSGRG